MSLDAEEDAVELEVRVGDGYRRKLRGEVERELVSGGSFSFSLTLSFLRWNASALLLREREGVREWREGEGEIVGVVAADFLSGYVLK